MIVTLQRTPLRLFERAEDYNAELMREFTLIALGVGSGSDGDVPDRLLELIAELSKRYGDAVAAPDTRREEATAAGAASADLSYDVPPEAGRDALLLAEMLDEAQQHCRAGDLITLCASDEVLEFQRWYTSEFVRQCEGEAARPWAGSLE